MRSTRAWSRSPTAASVVTTASIRCSAASRLDDNRELVVDRQQETSVPGLYAIGDVVSALNQISVAVGHAAIAATAIHNRLPHNFREDRDSQPASAQVLPIPDAAGAGAGDG
jgi:thioredoxin reductase (NADPH)